MQIYRLWVLTLMLISFPSWAQMTQKPSSSRVDFSKIQSKTAELRYLKKIDSLQDFDALARVYHEGTAFAIPHLLFVIDREKNAIYYINSRYYRYHKDFLQAMHWVLDDKNFNENTYFSPNRRFIAGTLAWQNALQQYSYEFWEGDLIPAEQIELSFNLVNDTFFKPVAFKPNSTRQDQLSVDLNIKRISHQEITNNRPYLALNTADAIGQIRLITTIDENTELAPTDIVVLTETPLYIAPVSGIILDQPSTALSHVNLLAKGWKIPNLYIKDALDTLAPLKDQWVSLKANSTSYSITPLSKQEIIEYQQHLTQQQTQSIKKAAGTLSIKQLASLKQLKKEDSLAYGAKAANLAEVKNAHILNVHVPEGFAIPFYHYQEFIQKNGLDRTISTLLDDSELMSQRHARRKALASLRHQMINAPMPEKLQTEIIQQWQTQLYGKGVFVRSSSNAEDIPGFSGAGLYTTVPNVVREEDIIIAVKTVWASLWNFEAFEARSQHPIDHRSVYMGVLIQEGVDMESSGVMITKDPFDKNHRGALYISAKRGLGIAVVEGKKIAEQVMYMYHSHSISVLTRSNDDTLLSFDNNGGIKKTTITNERRVLTDNMVITLRDISQAIKSLFKGTEQDIEWGYHQGRYYILQARPFVE